MDVKLLTRLDAGKREPRYESPDRMDAQTAIQDLPLNGEERDDVRGGEVYGNLYFQLA